MKGAGKRSRPAGAKRKPPVDLDGEPVDVLGYLQNAREDIDASRDMFKRGHLRQAVFFANQALELCVKAFMLRYRIIADARDSSHNPYPEAVRAMRRITESNAEAGTLAENYRRDAFKVVEKVDAVFCAMSDKRLRVIIWKMSLNIRLSSDERAEFKQAMGLVDLGDMATTARTKQEKGDYPGDLSAWTASETNKLFAVVPWLFWMRAAQRRSMDPLRLSERKTVQIPDAMRTGRMFAMVVLFAHLWPVVFGYAHQQASRYPTDIDGADSGDLYLRHMGGVKWLLGKIYRAYESLAGHLTNNTPLRMPDRPF